MHVSVHFRSILYLMHAIYSYNIHNIHKKDASDVTSTLETVWHKWYEIGVALKRPTDKLDAIFGKKDSVKNSFNVSPCSHPSIHPIIQSCQITCNHMIYRR